MKYIKILLILIFCSTVLYGAKKAEETLIVTVNKARIYKKASAFTKQVGRMAFGAYIRIEGTEGNWVKLSFRVRNKKGNLKKINGYVNKFSLIDEEGFKRQAESAKDRKSRETAKKYGKPSKFSEDDEVAAATKGFSEEDETAAATKGFSEDDEITAGSKGFSEEDEVTAGSKGFNKDVEAQYKKKHPKYKYDLVNKIDNWDAPNLYALLKPWWKPAKLGKYGPYNPIKMKRKK